jgi:hypothetical protein
MVSPAALSIVLTTFAEGTKRNRALAVWGAIASAAGAFGLLLGGAIAATNGVAPGDSGLASGLHNTTSQVGGALGLAILSTISTSRVTSALHRGAVLPAALTDGFKGAFTVAGILCAAGAALTLLLLPRKNELPRTNRSRRWPSRLPAAPAPRPVATSRTS